MTNLKTKLFGVNTLERSPLIETGLNLAIFKSSGKILFSSCKSNMNFKGTYGTFFNAKCCVVLRLYPF